MSASRKNTKYRGQIGKKDGREKGEFPAGEGAQKPSTNLASSDIRSGDHGGSKISSVVTSPTPAMLPTASRMSCSIWAPAGHPMDVSEYVTATVSPVIETS